jgi:inner membrane protein
MWHRGLTHSVFLVPLWALMIWWLCGMLFKRKDAVIYKISLVAVTIHIGSDALNAWGTGLLEPVSSVRISIGAIPIVDLVFWAAILAGWLGAFFLKRWPSHYMLRAAWAVMAIHVLVQTAQFYAIHQEMGKQYEEIAVSASFIPTQFQAFGKSPGKVEIFEASLFTGRSHVETLRSDDHANLRLLFEKNPRAEVLYAWSPFVVIVNNEQVLGIYDPRFYRNGDPLLAEYIQKLAPLSRRLRMVFVIFRWQRGFYGFAAVSVATIPCCTVVSIFSTTACIGYSCP